MKVIIAGLLLLATLPAMAQSEHSCTVYFETGKYNISRSAARQLDSLWQNHQMKSTRTGFELVGHCDSRGSNEYNYTLSRKRARAVQEYLVKRGVTREAFLEVRAAGELEPVNENKTAADWQLNRRVQIRIISSDSFPAAIKTERKSLKEKIADTSTTSGTRIVLRNINFLGGLHEFLQMSYPMLEELYDAMQSNPNLVIRVEGHICCQEGPGDGMDNGTGIENLSEARAKAVRDYLLEKGIAGNRITFKGFGHSAPIFPYPEKTEEERMLNRRVEIKIISK